MNGPGEPRSDAAVNTLDYLDRKIRYWRGQMDEGLERVQNNWRPVGADLSVEKAIAYIDAYQTMRMDLFGAALSDDA